MDSLHEDVLNELEARELQALAWGILDARLSETEVRRVIERVLEQHQDFTTDPGSVREALQQQAVLLDDGTGASFRTRLGESVRLFARLRQLFPQHLSAGTWSAAANLVFDYRLIARSRYFPRRDVIPAEVLEGLVENHRLTTIQVAALRHLLAVDDPNSRLAHFQVAATDQVLRQLGQAQATATIITAGTGSGKTRAFYMPALTDVVGSFSDEPWTKVVAVYPRVELLKDQLAEVIGQAHRVHLELEERSTRPIRIGAFFASTPHTNRISDRWGWRQRADGSVQCPYIACWACGAPMLWQEHDRTNRNEVLTCRDCGMRSLPDQLALTRTGMAHRPPDILFTTTEMVNRHISSFEYGRIFGVGTRARRPPRLLLLDEVHTYSGSSGAQAAFVLRRWQRAVRAPVHVVGLSATLEDAPSFMSRFTGIPVERITEIRPADGELEARGMEYMLALRGNPMSGTALLSSSIQALMLLRRILDQPNGVPSGNAFGSRVFAFTDDLDVTNRLYFNLLDAEGRTFDDRPRPGRESLANLRRPDLPDAIARRRDGQVWDVALAIGHQLRNAPVSISRTSSQDVGVDVASDVVVATASLEVGFDDLRVGGVLQHKAPRDAAAFLQRKGRAGRIQQMRPWTVVVLSDYGRDRLAYQGYDALFDPVLRPNPLPIGNRHVMKVQAALALMDWLATRMADETHGSLWSDLAGPVEEIYYWPTADRESARRRQLRAASLLRAVLEDAATTREFESFLTRALQLREGEANAVLWQSPRALMTSVIPILLRRLESNWRHQTRGPRRDVFSRRVPMPEHVPPSLFSELNLPEVELVAPARRSGASDWEESMPIAQALREMAPGRVTRRFSVREGAVRHWVPLPVPGTADVPIDDFLTSYEEIGSTTLAAAQGSTYVLPCLRPWAARLSVAPDAVADSQSAQLIWCSELTPTGPGGTLELPETRWSPLVRRVSFHTHGSRSELHIRRSALGSEATDPDNGERTITTRFVRRGESSFEPVTLGYVTTADGIRLEIGIPQTWPSDDELLRALRRQWFVHQVQESDALRHSASTFTRAWLATLYVAAVTATAATNDVDTATARQLLADADIGRALRRAMDIIFEVPTDADDGTAQHAARQRTADRLRDVLADQAVSAHLHQLGESLEGPLPGSAQQWLVRTLGVTVAAAIREAFQRLAPRLDVDSLLVELEEPDPSAPESIVVWLTEPVVGGGGIIEQLAEDALASPRRFLRLAEAAVGETDYELADRAQRGLIRLANTEPGVAETLANFRDGASPDSKRSILQRILDQLAEAGLPAGRTVAAAVAARLLRPGSTTASDAILLDLVNEVDRLETLLGFEPDARALAFALRNRFQLEQAVGAPQPDMGEPWRFAQIYSLMWPRGTDARAAGLSAYNRFAELVAPERLLVEALFADRRHRIDATRPDWRAVADEALATDGEVVLIAPHERRDAIRAALLNLALEPTDLGFIHAYPQVVGATTRARQIFVEVEIPEAP